MPLTTLATAMTLSAALFASAGAVPEPKAARPVQPFVEVDETAYASADWPEHNTDLYAKDLQGKKLPVALGQETWLTEEQDLNGKVLVLDFWATWCGPCIAAGPKLAKAQKDGKGDVTVVAISGQSEGIDKVRSYLDENEPKWVYLHDEDQRVFAPFESRGIPLVVVLSTDGVIRWMGNPHEKEFGKVVSQITENDPMIKALRAARAEPADG
jgi:thiol-disulfide isomerase/thioredoxin